MPSLAINSNIKKHAVGFTLIEVMVAVFIMAIIGTMTGSVFHSAMMNSEATEEANKRIAEVDRIWVMLETDFRNAIPKLQNSRQGTPLPAMRVSDSSDDYWLTLLRGGLANPLLQPRTEMVRIGYRIEDKTIWRDTWYDIRMTDQTDARSRKILEGVEDIKIRLLSPRATSLSAGPWELDWPARNRPDSLPLAVEITFELEDFGEVLRLYSLYPGVRT